MITRYHGSLSAGLVAREEKNIKNSEVERASTKLPLSIRPDDRAELSKRIIKSVAGEHSEPANCAQVIYTR